MRWEYETDTATALQNLKGQGYQIVAVEPATDAVDLFEWNPLVGLPRAKSRGRGPTLQVGPRLLSL